MFTENYRGSKSSEHEPSTVCYGEHNWAVQHTREKEIQSVVLDETEPEDAASTSEKIVEPVVETKTVSSDVSENVKTPENQEQ